MGRPATRAQRVKVISGGTQVKAEKVGRVIVTAGGTQVPPSKKTYIRFTRKK